jgi:hypothetical protein
VSPAVATKTTAPATALTWRNRITGSGQETPDQLLANPANWRSHGGTRYGCAMTASREAQTKLLLSALPPGMSRTATSGRSGRW